MIILSNSIKLLLKNNFYLNQIDFYRKYRKCCQSGNKMQDYILSDAWLVSLSYIDNIKSTDKCFAIKWINVGIDCI